MSKTMKKCYICHIEEGDVSKGGITFPAPIRPVFEDENSDGVVFDICPLCAELGKAKRDPMMKQTWVRMQLANGLRKIVDRKIPDNIRALRLNHDDIDQFLHLYEEMKKIANRRLGWMNALVEEKIPALPPKRKVGRPSRFESLFGSLPEDMSDYARSDEPTTPYDDSLILTDFSSLTGPVSADDKEDDFSSIFAEDDEDK